MYIKYTYNRCNIHITDINIDTYIHIYIHTHIYILTLSAFYIVVLNVKYILIIQRDIAALKQQYFECYESSTDVCVYINIYIYIYI